MGRDGTSRRVEGKISAQEAKDLIFSRGAGVSITKSDFTSFVVDHTVFSTEEEAQKRIYEKGVSDNSVDLAYYSETPDEELSKIQKLPNTIKLTNEVIELMKELKEKSYFPKEFFSCTHCKSKIHAATAREKRNSIMISEKEVLSCPICYQDNAPSEAHLKNYKKVNEKLQKAKGKLKTFTDKEKAKVKPVIKTLMSITSHHY